MSATDFSSRVVSHSLLGAVGMVGHKVLNLLTALVLIRGLSAEQFGTYSYIGVLLLFAGFVSDLGLERVLVRELARTPSAAPLLLANATILRIALGLGAVAVGLALGWFLQLGGSAWWCLLLGLVAMPLSMDNVGRAFFQSRFQMDRFYALTLATAPFYLGALAFCLWMRWPLVAIFALGLAHALVLTAGTAILVVRQVRPRWQIEKDILGLFLRDALQLGAFSFLFLAAMRIDQVLLFRWRGAEDVAVYAVGVRFAEALSLFPEAAMLSVLPAMAAVYHSRPERFRQLRQLAYRYLALPIVPLILVCAFAASELLALLFGPTYSASAPIVVLLAGNMFFAFMGAVFLNEFLIARWLGQMLAVSTISVATNVALNALWIPHHGPVGAAAATVVSSAVGFTCWLFWPPTRGTLRDCLREAARPVVAGAVAFAVVSLAGQAGWTAAGTSVAAYMLVLWALGGLTSRDIQRWATALRNVRPSWSA